MPVSRAGQGRSRRTDGGPSLRLARRLLRERGLDVVAGMDEVGRGALAGPVTVGVVSVSLSTRTAPAGLDDSKRLTPAAREDLAPRLARWAPAWAVGHASNDEIDEWGILFALRVAASRALAALPAAPGLVLLDGSYDYLHRPLPAARQLSLALPSDAAAAGAAVVRPGAMVAGAAAGAHTGESLVLGSARAALAGRLPPVELAVRADRRCSAVAAASVLAKVERDTLMTWLGEQDPRWGWQGNKGYSAPEHLAALRAEGPSRWHRRSWQLPGVEQVAEAARAR